MFPGRVASRRLLLVTDHEGGGTHPRKPRDAAAGISVTTDSIGSFHTQNSTEHPYAAHAHARRPLRCTLSSHPTCNNPHTWAAALRTQQPHPGEMPRDWSGAYTKPAAHWPLNPTSSTSLVGTSRSLLVGAARFTQRLLEWAGLPVRVRAEKANCRELGAAARAATAASGRLRSAAG